MIRSRPPAKHPRPHAPVGWRWRTRFTLALVAFAALAAFTATPALAASRALKVTVAGPGTVTGPGIECGRAAGPCEAEVEEGTPLTLTAAPTERSVFTAWGGCETENATECTLTPTATTEVSAEFTALPQQSLTLTRSGTGPWGGAVTGNSPGSEFAPIECGTGPETCAAKYNEGTTIILFATPAEGSAFVAWTGCTAVIGPTECEVTLSTARSVNAEFGALPEATLKPISGLTPGAVTLNAHLDPLGGPQITACSFEYLDDVDYAENARISREQGHENPWTGPGETPAQRVACQPEPPYPSATDVAASVGSLRSGAGYHDRILATNAYGTVEASGEFMTLARYRFSSDIGSSGTGPGQLHEPRSLALDDSTGYLYVADAGNHRVDEFDPSKPPTEQFVGAFGANVGGAGVNVCTSSCNIGTPGSTPGAFEAPTFIAVDNSSGPSAGDVYVADTADNLVQKFDPEGHLISNWEDGGTEEFGTGIAGIAVRSDGQLISQPGSGSGIALDANGTVYSGPVAIDPATHFLYTDTGTEIERSTYPTFCDYYGCSVPPQCSPATEACPVTEFFGAGHLSSAAGLAFDPSTEAVFAANTGEDDIAVFTPRPLPRLTTGPVTSADPTSATLTGQIDPAPGEAVTECYFEWGESTGYTGGKVPCSPATQFTSEAEVTAQLTKLTPFTTYHFRLVAGDAGGQGLLRYGNDRSFISDPSLRPAVGTTSTSAISPTTATLAAQINPELAPTIYRFQYGINTSYGSQTPPTESIGEDSVDHSVSTEIAGLQPATTYHFRVLAVNFNGITEGSDQTFTTPDLPTITDNAASDVTQTTATLSTDIRPGFAATTYHFEYGLTVGYGSRTPESGSIGSDNASHPGSAAVSALLPASTYHFRVVATNAFGTTDSADQTFTTASSAPIVAVPPPTGCKKGFHKKHGSCVRRVREKRHHKRSRSHG